MFFKKKTWEKVDTKRIKQEIINWSASHGVGIHLIEVFLGDFRDGYDLPISVLVFFKTNIELEKYKDNGFISNLKDETSSLLRNELPEPKEIDFVFDSHENVELNCNGNYLRYGIKNSN